MGPKLKYTVFEWSTVIYNESWNRILFSWLWYTCKDMNIYITLTQRDRHIHREVWEKNFLQKWFTTDLFLIWFPTEYDKHFVECTSYILQL